MNNYNFYVEKIRFHLYEESTLVVTGWFRDDNHKGRKIKVQADEINIEFDEKSNKGIDIRRKYVDYNANINEEVILILHLPEDFSKYNKLRIFTEYDGNLELSKSVSISQFLKEKSEISYYIEQEEYQEGKLLISGWVFDSDEVELSVVNKVGKELEAEITRSRRKDVNDCFFEADENIMAGFKLAVDMKDESTVYFCMKSGDKLTKYKIIVNHTKKSISYSKKQDLISKGIRYFKNYGTREFIHRARVKLFRTPDINYNKWRLKSLPDRNELSRQRQEKFKYMPLFSLIMPAFNTPVNYLTEMIDSVINQSYENWELCIADGGGNDSKLTKALEEYAAKDNRIKFVTLIDNLGISDNTNVALEMARGDYIVLVDHDDRIPEFALYECTKALNQDLSIDVIYSDEDKIDMKGKKYFEPHFKSDYNIDLLCSMNYICHLFVVKSTVIKQIGGFRSEYDGAQDYDFILRCCEQTENIYHIPKVLYHWRCHMDSTASNPESKLYAFEAGRKAVEAHYERVGIPAKVEHASSYGMYKTIYEWNEEPLVSIIIPNKDHIEDLNKCITAIEEKSIYKNYEYIIVENNSTKDETFEYYKKLVSVNEKAHVVYFNGEFNFSKINNFGAEHAEGELFLLLNNDTQIISEDCIKQMVDYCMRDDVGIVGARLLYADDTIQHAGVVIGFGGIAGHTFIGESRYDAGYFSRAICPQDYSAVTAACMMTKRSVFEAVGGLTEELKVAFNDIDYCLKVRKMKKLVVYNPYAELYHFESKSRGAEDTHEKVERFNKEIAVFETKWEEILQNGDPYYNKNLTLDKADFSLKK